MCQMVLNPKLNGIEVYFENKPENIIIEALKKAGYRWHNAKKCWYAKQNDKTMKTATELSSCVSNEVIDNATKNTSYYPSYDEVGCSKIFKSSDKDLLNVKSGYFADELVYVVVYDRGISITDLSNALKTGLTCKRYSVNPKNWQDNATLILYNDNKIKTVKELVAKIKNGQELQGLNVQISEQKSSKTFSPFVEIKPIKTPQKWTKAHLWKAILSGQVYKGYTDYHYTDDYLYDAQTNFSKGVAVDLIRFADELIDSSSQGISIREDKKLDNGDIIISCSNYRFDSKSFYFNESCNFTKGAEILKNEAQELKQYNDDLLAKVLNITPSDIENNALYNISYLEKNGNTGRYQVINKMIYAGRLFYEDECNYLITEISRFMPENKIMYSISNFHNRPYGDSYNDKRIIDLGNYKYVVTGYALNELLNEGKVFATIQECREARTIEAAREYLQNFISGTMQILFSKNSTNYTESLYRLNAEELRIQEVLQYV